jgi:hypothetical protein
MDGRSRQGDGERRDLRSVRSCLSSGLRLAHAA